MGNDAGISVSTTIALWLTVRNSSQAVEFYKAAFGAVEVFRLGPDESVIARLSVDGAEFSVRIIFTVADPDAVFARAIKAGASQVYRVHDEHGWRLGRVVDPYGHHWEIGRPLAQE